MIVFDVLMIAMIVFTVGSFVLGFLADMGKVSDEVAEKLTLSGAGVIALIGIIFLWVLGRGGS